MKTAGPVAGGGGRGNEAVHGVTPGAHIVADSAKSRPATSRIRALPAREDQSAPTNHVPTRWSRRLLSRHRTPTSATWLPAQENRLRGYMDVADSDGDWRDNAAGPRSRVSGIVARGADASRAVAER